MNNLENKIDKCVWRIAKVKITKCMNCEGYNRNCKDYLGYFESQTTSHFLQRYQKMLDEDKNARR